MEMNRISNKARQLIQQIDKRKLSNNTQRALFALLTTDEEWVSRSSLRIPSAAARLRDLRKDEFGAFDIECLSSTELSDLSRKQGKTSTRTRNPRSTFYRLNPRTVTISRIMRVFGEQLQTGVEGVVSK
jgi:hypothetical protein